ncbi:hypothetical protein CROQUDRAFT_713552 [Cronartium quercuum f. sp. fusiforme G11]|uniref:Uncharacterized protein n=1 Tax=Cronartium quercuum f. sp. fusiforme G11 TaxID=708437 RepID=A0A9P6NRD8_9BASI|nr:hypothetical protein CROQUDRAFT_713552 [Cronartium quercuum f. sp. fusiforme G11]
MVTKKRSIVKVNPNSRHGTSKRPCRTRDDPSDRIIAADLQLEIASAGTNYLSMRTCPRLHSPLPPTLSDLCLDVLARSFTRLFLDANGHQSFHQNKHATLIRSLPTHLIQTLFHLILKPAVPSFTPENLISLFFGDKLTQINFSPIRIHREFLAALPSCRYLTKLHLTAQPDLEDRALVRSLRQLSSLQELNLSSCVKIGDPTVKAIAETSKTRLLVINLNFTAVTTHGLISLLGHCPKLEVLKLSNVTGLKDGDIRKLIDEAIQLAQIEKQIPLSSLKTLKLKSTPITDTGLGRLLGLCASTLERLDISYTKVERLDVLRLALFRHHISDEPSTSPCKLVKLVISGLANPSVCKHVARTSRSPDSIFDFFEAFVREPEKIRDRFETLKMEYMGGSRSLGRSEMMPVYLTDNNQQLGISRLNRLIPFLYKLKGLRQLSLRGNIFLAPNFFGRNDEDIMAPFIHHIGRRCEHLDLSDITHLGDSTILSGLSTFSDLHPLPEEADQLEELVVPTYVPPRLKTLILDKTNISEESAQAIANCKDLECLFVRETRMTSEGLKQIIEACPKLYMLDLTSCRGVPLRHRRDFFKSLE